MVGDPIQREVLEEADVASAHSVIILGSADEGAGAKGADARTILIALALQSVRGDVHTCAEMLDKASAVHFARTSVTELVCIRDVAARLIAHAAQKHFLTDFFGQLLTVSRLTNEVYALDVPDALVGASFAEVQRIFRDSPLCDVLPIGVQRETPRTRGGEALRR